MLVDDDALISESLKILLELQEDIKVVDTASNGEEAVRKVKEHHRDVILMDIRMPICDGIIGTKKIKDDFPSVSIIILTTFHDDEYIFQALKNGARGYILKNTPSDKIREQIKLAYHGTMLIHGDIADRISNMLHKDQKKDLSAFGLTPREIEITILISKGYSNKEISEKLYLGESTIKNYISSILAKLDLRDRTQIAVFYLTE